VLSASVRHYPGKGTQTSWRPLLPGYVFVNLMTDTLIDATLYATGRCVHILRVSQQDHFVTELNNLLTLAEQAPSPLIVQPHLVPGIAIIIRQGTFAGCQGLVQRRQGITELVVNLQVLGCSVATTLPAEWADQMDP
jgi:transcription antitermination factor NusG